MDTSYRFTSTLEPSDEQLEGLMQAALQEVRERAAIADKNLKPCSKKQIEDGLKKWKEKHGQK